MGAGQFELAADEIGWHVNQRIQSMGLEHELIRTKRATFVAEAGPKESAGVQLGGSAEAHDSFTPGVGDRWRWGFADAGWRGWDV